MARMSQRAVEVRKERERERMTHIQLSQCQDLNWTSQYHRAEIKCREDQRRRLLILPSNPVSPHL